MLKKQFLFLTPDEQEKKETEKHPLGPKPGGPGSGKKADKNDDNIDDILDDIIERNKRVNETDEREGQ